jgi:putative endonuclease
VLLHVKSRLNMAKTAKRTIGDTGEDVACKYLESKGYRVLERNYLRPWGEIDIIAEQAKKLYFVEVKSVSREISSKFHAEDELRSGIGEVSGSRETYRPEENVHPAKLKRLHRAIQTYLLDHKVPETTDWQVDIACVYLDFSARKAKVEMLKNVIL